MALIAITGSSGLLGSYLLKTQPVIDEEYGQSYNHKVVPLYNRHPVEGGVQLDLSDRDKVIRTFFDINPDMVIHCAANGNVDSVESNPSEAVKSDLLGTVYLKEVCDRMDIKMLSISTNAVYEGIGGNYGPWTPHKPTNIYGKLKSIADQIVVRQTPAVIVRPHMLYGWGKVRTNWVQKLLRMKEVKMVTDYLVQPVYAYDLAVEIWKIIDYDFFSNYGTDRCLNISSKDKMSLYDFGLIIKDVFGLDVDIQPAKISDFKIAPRGLDTTFDPTRTMPNVYDGLKRMKNEKGTD